MKMPLKTISACLALALLALPGFGAPTIQHDPIKVAQKGQPLGVRATVRDAAARDPWLRAHPPTVSWPGGQFASGRTVEGHPVIEQLATAVSDCTGQSAPALAAAPYGSDLRLYAGVGGIPSLHFGPGDVRMAHAPREQVALDELIGATRALLVLAARRCGAHL